VAISKKKVEIAQPVPSKAKESSALLAITYNYVFLVQRQMKCGFDESKPYKKK
jgi:hypothetical protein